MTHNHVEAQHADETLLSGRVEAACCVSTCRCFTGLNRVRLQQKGKVSAAVVTLGNILPPVCYRCHGLHFPSTPTEKLSFDLWCFLHVWQLFCLYYLLFLFDPFIEIFGWRLKKKKKKEKDNGVGFLWMSMVGVEGAHDRWQISVLWCRCGHWETSGCMCDSPALRSSHDLYCMSSSSYWVVLQENVCHQPLNMCLNDISPVCLWECLFPRDGYVFVLKDRDY